MPSTKMFRDRVVSMEQTFEKGEKHLALLQGLVGEAIPGLEFLEYLLDHEHDTFVMVYRAGSGEEKRIRWTRMVLYDAERIPALVDDAQAPIRARLVEFLRRRGERPVIDVTFRHLEEGWVDTPEPRKPKPRPPQPQRPASPGSQVPRPPAGRGAGGQRPSPPPAGRPAPQPPKTGAENPAPAGAGRRRRFRRRRGRRRGAGPGPGPGAGPASPGGAPSS